MAYTLLLADDSVTIQRVIELTFADEDVTVVAVGDGDQAIERLEASPPDIVLADVGMPGRNGYEVAQYIRRSPTLSHIPVVLLTGAFEPVDQARADDAGCNGVLAKPFEPQLVISRVKELLARPDATLNRPSTQVSEGARQEDVSETAQTAIADPVDLSWAPQAPKDQSAESLTAAEAPRSAADAHPDLSDYFDQLDAAFAKLKPAAAEPPAGTAPSAPVVDQFVHSPAPPAQTVRDWFAAVADVSHDQTSPVSADLGNAPEEPAALTHASAQPVAPVALPEVEESFAAVNTVEPVPELAALDAVPLVDHAAGIAPDDRLAPIEESAPIESEPGSAFPADSQSIVAPASAAANAEPAAAFAAPSSAARLELPLPDAPPLPHLADAFAALLAAEQGESLPVGALWPASEPAPPAPAVISEETIDAITRRVLEKLSDSVVRQAVADITSTIAERVIREEIERIKAAIK